MIEQSRASNKSACVSGKGVEAAAKYQAISKLPKDQIGMVMMAEAMVAQAAALSNKKDPCDMGMGYFEYAASVANSQNEAVAKIVPGVVSGTVAGLGIITAGDVLKTAFQNSGNQTSTTINGDNNTANHEHVQTTSNVSNSVSADGENSAPSVTNPAVTGPNQASTETTTNNGIVPEGSTLAGAEEPIAAEHIGVE